jgi:anti-anti-sigma factor
MRPLVVVVTPHDGFGSILEEARPPLVGLLRAVSGLYFKPTLVKLLGEAVQPRLLDPGTGRGMRRARSSSVCQRALPPFATSVEHDGHETVIRVRGEVDLSNCERLREVIEPCVDAGAKLVVDLAAVDFMDSSCLRVLAWASTTILDEGGSFSLRNPSPIARRLLEVTGLAFLLD